MAKNRQKFDHDLQLLADSLRTQTGWDRDRCAAALSDKINSFIAPPQEGCNRDNLQKLKQRGNVKIDDLFTEQQIKDMREYLDTQIVYNQHVPPGQKSFRLEDSDNRFNSYHPKDLLKCPHLLEGCLKDSIVALATEYLGCAPTLYSISAFWMLQRHTGCSSGPDIVSGIQKFHRDYDDFKFLAFFVYLTDVDDCSAPHLFVEGSHLTHGEYAESEEHKVLKYVGKKGTTFAEDTYGIHSGGVGEGLKDKLNNDRLILWLRFGLHKNAPIQAQLPNPFPASEVNCEGIDFDENKKFITRFIIQH